MRSTSFHISVVTGLIVTAILTAYSRILDVLAHTSLNLSFIQMLGVLSIVIMPLGMYFGLRRLRYLKSQPLRWFETLLFGMIMVMTATLGLIVIQTAFAALELGRFSSISEYFTSLAPLRTSLWFSSLGLIYSLIIHFIIDFQFKRHENKN